MSAATTDGGSRPYALRVRRLDDHRQRDAVAAVVASAIPAAERAAVVRALGESGYASPLELDDQAAAALLRDLYATGVAPAAVALLPRAQRRTDDPDLDRRMGVFAGRGGRFVPTWNWRAFVLGPIWYLKRGLYAKGLVLLALTLIPIGTLTTTLVLSMAALFYCGLAGDWDEYLWRVKRTQWW
jgi:hypothetical protein